MGIFNIFNNTEENNSNKSSEQNLGVKEIEALINKGTPCADAIKNASRFIESQEIEKVLEQFAVDKENVDEGVIFTFEGGDKLNFTNNGILKRVKNRATENANKISHFVNKLNELDSEDLENTHELEVESDVKVPVNIKREESKRPKFKKK